MKKGLVLLILISGCAAPGPEQPAEPEAPPAVSTPPSENVAVASLMDNARAEVAAIEPPLDTAVPSNLVHSPAAKGLGLTIPLSLLARADSIIE